MTINPAAAALAARFRNLTDNGKKNLSAAEAAEADEIWNQYQAAKGTPQMNVTTHSPFVGRDGGRIGDGASRRFAAQHFGGDGGSVQDAGVSAWLKASCGRRIDRGDHEAMEAAGFHSGMNAITIHQEPHGPLWGDALTQYRIQNTMHILPGGAGGYLAGPGIMGAIADAERDFSTMMRIATIERTADGTPLMIPTADDDSNTGERLGSSGATDQDVEVGMRVLGSNTYSSKVIKVRRELLQDSAYNLESFLGRKIGRRIGQAVNGDCTNGPGAGAMPMGIVTQSELGVTAASTSAITGDEILDTIYSVDESYRNKPGCGFMMADSTFKTIEKLKDGQGLYLLNTDFSAGGRRTIRGYPVFINRAMPTIAASAKVILFGDFSAYLMRESGALVLLRLDQRYAEFNQIAFLAFARWDGLLVDPGIGLVKHLAMHA